MLNLHTDDQAERTETRKAIDGLLTSAQLSTAEKGCLANVLQDRVRPGRYVSPFTTSLFDSMLLASPGDLTRLSACFPNEVAAHRARESGQLSAKARLVLGDSANLLD
jgi:hypothetical protein